MLFDFRSARGALLTTVLLAVSQLSATPNDSAQVSREVPLLAAPTPVLTPPTPAVAPPAPAPATVNPPARLDADLHRARVAIDRISSTERRRLDPAFLDTIAQAVVASGRRHDIDPLHLVVLGWHESRFRNEVRSSEGACGIVQVMPRERIRGRPSCAQLQDPTFAIEWAAQELASLELDFAAYAGGRGGRNRVEAVRYGYRHWMSYERLRRELRGLEAGPEGRAAEPAGPTSTATNP